MAGTFWNCGTWVKGPVGFRFKSGQGPSRVKVTTTKQQALPLKDQRAKLMAEAKQLAEKVDKQTKVIEEAVEKRAAPKEELVTAVLKIKSLPPDTLPVPKPSPATSLASSSSSAVEQLLECALQSAGRKGGPG
eukprot:6490269-Amphidinium_carterae.2